LRNSIFLMFPIFYKIVLRIILTEDKNNNIYCSDELKTIVSEIMKIFDINVNFYSVNDKKVYENMHFITIPEIEEFYKILNNYTIDKVYFKSQINFWFYINKNDLKNYDEFEKKLNERFNYFNT